jgi:superfamily I DNA/RNA helicase
MRHCEHKLEERPHSRYRGDNQVPLMTITKSKGLEYDVVVLLGLDDNDWWSFQKNPDEGHSTFFVAASRARERLFMTLCKGQRTSKISEIYQLLDAAGVKTIKSDGLICVAPFPDGKRPPARRRKA